MNLPEIIRIPVSEMTTETIGKDLLQAFVTEAKLMPEVWAKLSEDKQNDVLDRLRARVEANVQQAVALMISQGHVAIKAIIDQITIKDGVKALLKFDPTHESLVDLYEAQGHSVIVGILNDRQYLQGIETIQGEPNQQALSIGQEYSEHDAPL